MDRPSAKAAAYLNDTVERARVSPDRPLPGVRALASGASVALVTMVRAVAAAKAAGAVATFPGRGTFVLAGTGGASALPPRPRPAAQLRWEQAAQRLRHDLVSRAFPSDRPLPTAKELAARYGVCVPTVRKALRHLEAAGAVRREPGGLLPSHGDDRRIRASLCMIVPGMPYNPFETLPERDHVLLRAFAAECRQRGIHLDFCFAEYSGSRRVRPDRSYDSFTRARPGTTFLGFAVLALAFHREALLDLLGECGAVGYPIVVLDETGVTASGTPENAGGAAVVRFATSAGCGLTVGRHLAGLGHSRIAFLHHAPLAVWSQARLDGLRESLREAGLAEQVDPIAVDSELPGSSNIDDFFRSVAAHPLKPARRQAAMRRALERLTIPLNVYWREEMRRGPLYRALSELLRRGDTTAWVAESSALAVECLRYLRERRVRAPQSLSVAGFDDSTESQLAGCTSFDFDMQSVARQTIDLLVATPRAPGARPELREVEVAGFLTVRSSTGPAPRSPGER